MRPADHCFVCGKDNPIGLKLEFVKVGEGVRAEFTPSTLHVGYDGVVHGGIIASLIDDALANVWFARGQEALTAKIEVRYRHEIQPGDRLIISAHPTGAKGGLMTGRAEVSRSDGVIVAEGSGFLTVKPVK